MRALILLLVATGCAGSHIDRLVELRRQHARALSMATRDDDQPRMVVRMFAERGLTISIDAELADPRVAIDLPPLDPL